MLYTIMRARTQCQLLCSYRISIVTDFSQQSYVMIIITVSITNDSGWSHNLNFMRLREVQHFSLRVRQELKYKAQTIINF
jgi:hypothetical protein